jgi:hypothetical protein
MKLFCKKFDYQKLDIQCEWEINLPFVITFFD